MDRRMTKALAGKRSLTRSPVNPKITVALGGVPGRSADRMTAGSATCSLAASRHHIIPRRHFPIILSDVQTGLYGSPPRSEP